LQGLVDVNGAAQHAVDIHGDGGYRDRFRIRARALRL
jgi:hypothetical protein